jgi:hypothetical protein
MPVEFSTELVINLATAKALGEASTGPTPGIEVSSS